MKNDMTTLTLKEIAMKTTNTKTPYKTSAVPMIRTLFSRARDYVYKMQLRADIVGLELDLAMARRQTAPMPELEKTIEEEISLAIAMIDNIDTKREALATPMVPAADLHRATKRSSLLEQRLHDMCERCSELQQRLYDAHAGTNKLAKLVADDSHAATYQSLGQYRSAIKQFMTKEAK